MRRPAASIIMGRGRDTLVGPPEVFDHDTGGDVIAPNARGLGPGPRRRFPTLPARQGSGATGSVSEPVSNGGRLPARVRFPNPLHANASGRGVGRRRRTANEGRPGYAAPAAALLLLLVCTSALAQPTFPK